MTEYLGRNKFRLRPVCCGILDFFVSGQYALIGGHGLTDNEAYRLVDRWDSILRKISVALRRSSELPEQNPLVLAFQYVVDKFAEKYREFKY